MSDDEAQLRADAALSGGAAPPSAAAAAASGGAAVATGSDLRFAQRKRIRKKTPRELADDAVRLRQDSLLYNLTLDVNNLKQEIRNLELNRRWIARQRTAAAQLHPDSASMKMVRYYFKLYHHGLDVRKQEHTDFIHACLDSGLTLGTTPFGLDMFFEQWRLHTELFQIKSIILESTEIVVSDDEECAIRCVVSNHGRLSRDTIAAVFPSALSNEALVAKLVGRKIVNVAEVTFYVTRASGKVYRLDTNIDMVLAFSEVLNHNPYDVECLMGSALIAEGSMIGEVAALSHKELQSTDASPQQSQDESEAEYGSLFSVRKESADADEARAPSSSHVSDESLDETSLRNPSLAAPIHAGEEREGAEAPEVDRLSLEFILSQ